MKSRVTSAGLCLIMLLAACSGSSSSGGVKPAVRPSTTVAPGSATTRPVSTTTSIEPKEPQSAYAVGSRTLTVVDKSRSTAASPKRGLAAVEDRTLPLLVLYPAAGSTLDTNPVADAPVAPGRFPIVEFSHGVTATGPAYQPFLISWAKAGYVVVAPTFPLTSGPQGWTDLGDYRQQPADVSFILTQIVALDNESGDPLDGHLATKTVAVAGHSLGAITTLGFYNSCCTDPRIDAAIEISGVEAPFGNGSFGSSPKVPLLLIHGKEDKTVPYAGSADAFKSLPGPRALVTMPGADHVDVIFGPKFDKVTVDTTVAFLDLELRDDPARWNALPPDLSSGVATLAEAGGLPAPGKATGG